MQGRQNFWKSILDKLRATVSQRWLVNSKVLLMVVVAVVMVMVSDTFPCTLTGDNKYSSIQSQKT